MTGVVDAGAEPAVTVATITDLADELSEGIGVTDTEPADDSSVSADTESTDTAGRTCVCGAPLRARQWFCSAACKQAVTWNCVETLLLRAGK